MVNHGDMASATCAVTKGDLPLKISWFFDNKPAKELPGVAVAQMNQRISMLSIESAAENHIGEFVCEAESVAGKTAYSTFLNVNGRLFSIDFFMFLIYILFSIIFLLNQPYFFHNSSSPNNTLHIW